MAPITAIQGRTAAEIAATSTQTYADSSPRDVPRASPVRADEAPPHTVDPARLQEAREDVQALLDEVGTGHRVGFHEDAATGTMVVEIRDEEGRLIRQFPPEKLLNLQEKLADLSGMVIDETT